MNGTVREDVLVLDAPAKINLFLRVIGRRDDGYHELQSLIGFTQLGDRLTASPGEDLQLAIEGPFAGSLAAESSQNLVLTAAHALRDRFRCSKGANLRLEKNLPISSGIGGGSSDAAATLRVLASLWELADDELSLMEMAADLGSDVPVCLFGGLSIVGGAGEVVETVPPLPGCAVLLANGGAPVPTARVFRSGLFPAAAKGWSSPADLDDLTVALAERGNDLTSAAVAIAPVVGDVLKAVAATRSCRYSAMSGSGGTCFGIYPDPGAAEAAARSLEKSHPDWWIRATRFRTERASIRRLKAFQTGSS